MLKNRVLAGLLSVALIASITTGCTVKYPSKEYVDIENEVPIIGPYSQMLRSNGFVYCSAQVAFDHSTEALVDGDITAQTKQVFSNFESQLEQIGLTMDSAVKVTVYLTDMNNFTAMNDEYKTHFNEPYPVRTCVEVSALPVEGALISVDAVFADK